MNFSLACPSGYEFSADFVRSVEGEFSRRGRRLSIGNDPMALVRGADFLYSDVWVSMGQEGQKEEKTSHFLPFQVNAALLEAAGSQALVTHCLPAHRGEEITDEVMDCPRCVCFDEAENRLHAQKAVLRRVFKATGRI
jgi:ornithine carbamoyltransferase